MRCLGFVSWPLGFFFLKIIIIFFLVFFFLSSSFSIIINIFFFLVFSLVSPRLFSWFQEGDAYRRVGCLMVKGKGGGVRWEWVALAHLGRSWPQALCEHVTPRRVLLRLQEDPHVWLSFSSPRLHATPPPLVSILCISISFLFTVVLFSMSALPAPSFFFSSPPCFVFQFLFSSLYYSSSPPPTLSFSPLILIFNFFFLSCYCSFCLPSIPMDWHYYEPFIYSL